MTQGAGFEEGPLFEAAYFAAYISFDNNLRIEAGMPALDEQGQKMNPRAAGRVEDVIGEIKIVFGSSDDVCNAIRAAYEIVNDNWYHGQN